MLPVQDESRLPTRKAFEPQIISSHKTMQIVSRYVNLKAQNKGTTMSRIVCIKRLLTKNKQDTVMKNKKSGK